MKGQLQISVFNKPTKGFTHAAFYLCEVDAATDEKTELWST